MRKKKAETNNCNNNHSNILLLLYYFYAAITTTLTNKLALYPSMLPVLTHQGVLITQASFSLPSIVPPLLTCYYLLVSPPSELAPATVIFWLY